MDNELISQKEKIYFVILLISSLLLYFFFFISVIGIFILFLLVLVPLILFLLTLGQIRTNGVKVTKNQFPSIYQMVVKTAEDMGISSIPDVYIVQFEGALNAFASKFFQKNMIVIYSELADLIVADREKELRFVIAHELAHIKRNHVVKQLLLLPGNWIPFLGNAYSRSCEYTCDTMAAHYISDLESSKRALIILAIGKQLSKDVDINEYLLEASKEDNLFSWLSEKISTHPNLPKRIANIQYKLGEPYRFHFTTSVKVKMIITGLVTIGLLVIVGGVHGFQVFQKTSLYSDFMLESEGTTPLMLAVSDGDMDKVEDLLKEEIDINAKDADGWTALHYAISWQDYDVEDYDELVETPTNVELVKLLLEYGADPNSTDQYGDTIVSYATTQGYFECVKLLINEGADLNIDDEYGETPLFDAVYMEDLNMVQFLLDNGAYVNVENSDGQTVIDIASENKNEEILTILKDYQ
ncbi:MAG: M48 family metallopeptidase [Bacillota bacterium]